MGKSTRVNNRIRELRQARNATQADLARQVGVTRQTVNAIEQGKYSPSLEVAFRIAAFLEEDLTEVFSYDD